jgi:acetyl-CoA carboxylase biotin carboxyl carrier protein
MSIDEDDVLLILDLFAASDWDDLSVATGDVRLSVSKRAGAPAATVDAPERLVGPGPQTAQPNETKAPPPPVAVVDEEPPPGIVAVRSPTLGTFFVAPKPGAPPFVTTGATVAAGDTVAIVEVMKLMNPVKAGVDGEIVKVCARNNELVEYDRVLFWIKPLEAA